VLLIFSLGIKILILAYCEIYWDPMHEAPVHKVGL